MPTVTHSFLTRVLKETTWILNLASVCAASGERTASALTMVVYAGILQVGE
ncbi:MAG: hypothetical protein JO288_09290 [Hyphomicrobiales bacterium]|nr:hypothetical protein [Hyphomicrobiales bacterium]